MLRMTLVKHDTKSEPYKSHLLLYGTALNTLAQGGAVKINIKNIYFLNKTVVRLNGHINLAVSTVKFWYLKVPYYLRFSVPMLQKYM